MKEKIEGLLGTPRKRTIALFVCVTFIYALVAFLYVGPVFSKDTTKIITTSMGDATAGLTWLTTVDTGGPAPDHITHLTNYPYGDPLRDPFQVTAVFNIGGMWVLSHILGAAIPAWNMMILLAYLSSALAMFGFIRWLTRNNWVAFFAGFAVTFTPYHQLNALGHLSFMLSAGLILALWAFLAFWRSPSIKRAIVFAAATALCFYTDGYYIFIAGLLVASLVASAFVIDRFVAHKKGAYLRLRSKRLLLYVAAVIFFLAPVAFIKLHYSSRISSTLASSRGSISDEVNIYAARPSEYILPSVESVYTTEGYNQFRESRAHGSNATESSLYLGVSVIALACFAWIWFVRNPKKDIAFRDLSLGYVLMVLTATALLAFVFSLPPEWKLFGHSIPMPSWFVYHVTAMWRVFARLYLVVDLCIVTIAAIGVYLLVRGRSFAKQALIVIPLIVLVMFDMLTGFRGATWNYAKAPTVYPWLKTQNVKAIAEYPMDPPPSEANGAYLTYQQIHMKPLINTSRADSPEKPLEMSISRLGDAQTVPVLKKLGASLVLMHKQSAENVPGLSFVRYDIGKYGDTVWTYKINDDVVPADYAVLPGLGFDSVAPQYIKPLHRKFSMTQQGVINLRQLGNTKQETVKVSMQAEAIKDSQFVTISQQGVVRWQGTIDADTVTMDFDADPSLPLVVDTYKPKGVTTITIHDMIARNE